MKKLMIVALAGVLVLQMTPLLVQAQETYNAGIYPHIGFSELIVADEKKFDKDEGVDINIVHYTGVLDWISALGNYEKAKIDFSHTWTSTHIDLVRKDVYAVNLGIVSMDMGNTKMIIKKGMDPKELIGKPIAIPANYFAMHYFVYYYLKSQGIDFSRDRLVPMKEEEAYKNFKSNRLKAIVVAGDYINKAINEGNGIEVCSNRDIEYATMPSFVNFNKGIGKPELKKVMRAILKAHLWIINPSNKEEYRKILVKTFQNDLALAGMVGDSGYEETRKTIHFLTPEELFNYNGKPADEFKGVAVRDAYEKMEISRKDIGYQDKQTYSIDDMVNTNIMLELLEEMGLGPKPPAGE